MTREEIEKLTNRELDLAVAKLMGWRYRWKFGGWINPLYVTLEPPDSTEGILAPDPLPADAVFHGCLTHYSSDIAAAWQVVESWKYNFVISREMGLCGTMETAGTKKWRVLLCAPGMEMAGIEGDELPALICRAALLAVFATPAAPAMERGAR
jgi:hypothetical protein